MEWHHILPQCLFGNQSWGCWLTLRQHAIASAFQTLAFGRCCLHGKHLQFLSEPLLGLTKFYRDELSLENLGKMTPEQFQEGQDKKRQTVSSQEYDWKGVRIKNGTYDVMVQSGLRQVKEAQGIHKPDAPREEWCIKGGETQGRNNVVNKTGMFKRTAEELSEASKRNRSRKFRCLVTGKVSTDGGLTKIQRRLGIDTSLREQIN
jgi:hypothetical protein